MLSITSHQSMPRVWDPVALFELVNPDKGYATCVGEAKTQKRRCWVRPAAHNHSTAKRKLEGLSTQRPSMSMVSDLQAVVGLTLCRRFHQDQVNHVLKLWKRTLEREVQKANIAPLLRAAEPAIDAFTVDNGHEQSVSRRNPRGIGIATPTPRQRGYNIGTESRTTRGSTTPPSPSTSSAPTAFSTISQDSSVSHNASMSGNSVTALEILTEIALLDLRLHVVSPSTEPFALTAENLITAFLDPQTPQAPSPPPEGEGRNAPMPARPAAHNAVAGNDRTENQRAVMSCTERHFPRRPLDDECTICFGLMTNAPRAQLVWCKTCGVNLHSACFETWRASSERNGLVRCIFCRSGWAESCGHDHEAVEFELWTQPSLGLEWLFAPAME